MKLCGFFLLFMLPGLLGTSLFVFKEETCDDDTMLIRCPQGTTIQVEEATYGKPEGGGMLCPIKKQSSSGSKIDEDDCVVAPVHKGLQNFADLVIYQKIVNLCQDKQTCRIPVSSSSMGMNPCPGTTKHLSVSHKCKPGKFFTSIACEGGQAELNCRPSNRVAIFTASFGHSPGGTPECFDSSLSPDLECQSSYSLEIVMRDCHGRKQCSVLADPVRFDDTCPDGMSRYLTIVYSCVPKRILKRIYQQDDDTGNSMLEGQPSYIPSPSTVNSDAAPKNKSRRPNTRGKEDVYVDYSPEDSHNKEFIPMDELPSTSATDSQTFQTNGKVMQLLADCVMAVHYIKDNKDKFLLYFLLSIAVGVVLLLGMLTFHLIKHHKRKHTSKLQISETKSMPKPSLDDVMVTADLLSDTPETMVKFNGHTFRGSHSPPSLPRSLQKHRNCMY